MKKGLEDIIDWWRSTEAMICSGGKVGEPMPEEMCPECGKSLMGMYWFCTYCNWHRDMDVYKNMVVD